MGLLADGRSAVIEMARASGVELVPRDRRNPLTTTSFGTGELMLAAVRRGCHHLLIGIGGSATVDGAAGCVQALGARLLDTSGAEIPSGGGALSRLASIDARAMKDALAGVTVTVLCDVTNPLIGPLGAARVFGPQKGATPAMVETLEANLTHFAALIRRDLGLDVVNTPGGGAAGGLGAGLVAFADATLAPGGATVIDLLGYARKLDGVDLVITGEGKLDAQTGGGKAVQRIAEVAERAGIPVVALAGALEADGPALRQMGIQSAWSIIQAPCSLDEALARGADWLAQAATELGNLLALR
jgi:glycerate kinase